MNVWEDFEKENDPRKDMEGILKCTGEEIEFEMEDGERKTFGKDMSCDFIVPSEEVDDIQF